MLQPCTPFKCTRLSRPDHSHLSRLCRGRLDSSNGFNHSMDSRLFSVSNLRCSNCALSEPDDERCFLVWQRKILDTQTGSATSHSQPTCSVCSSLLIFARPSSPLFQDLVIWCASTSFPAPGLKQSNLGVRKFEEDDLKRPKKVSKREGWNFACLFLNVPMILHDSSNAK